MSDMTDLADRLRQAIATTRARADAPAAPDENSTQMAIRMVRLDGVAQGIQEALDYVQEAQQAACTSRSSSHPDDALPCLLPGGHDGWHKGLGATWSGGAQ